MIPADEKILPSNLVIVDDILSDMELTSLYLHIPFCNHRCAYCDFNTYAGLGHLIPHYVDALCRELEWVVSSSKEVIPVHTIYFGGGTPSLLTIKEVEIILRTIRDGFLLDENVEITMESNPGTLTREYLQGIRDQGVNRLSIGMQSAHAFELNLLDRLHSFDDVIHSVAWAHSVGFENINLDLIYDLPTHSLDAWSRSVQLALDLHPEHFSLYALTLEDDVPMAQWIHRGLLAPQDTDQAADMYELAEKMLSRAGYESYEISNWARCDVAGYPWICQHNLQYWKGKPYLGLGAGAHGFINHARTANVLRPQEYIQQMQTEPVSGKFVFPVTPATMEYKKLSPKEEMGEYMMVALRLTQDGVEDNSFSERFGHSLEAIYGKEINRFIINGLLEWVDGPSRRLRLTKRGRLLGNQVFCSFI